MGDWTFFAIVLLLGALAIGAIIACTEGDKSGALSKDERRKLAVLRGHADVAYPMAEPVYSKERQRKNEMSHFDDLS